jgi:hypothetical protein
MGQYQLARVTIKEGRKEGRKEGMDGCPMHSLIRPKKNGPRTRAVF